MQETMSSRKSAISSLSNCWPVKSFRFPALGRRGGGGKVAVLFKKNCDVEVLSGRKDSDGRVLSLLIKSENQIYALRLSCPIVKNFYILCMNIFPLAPISSLEATSIVTKVLWKSLEEMLTCKKNSDFYLVDVWRKNNQRNANLLGSILT